MKNTLWGHLTSLMARWHLSQSLAQRRLRKCLLNEWASEQMGRWRCSWRLHYWAITCLENSFLILQVYKGKSDTDNPQGVNTQNSIISGFEVHEMSFPFSLPSMPPPSPLRAIHPSPVSLCLSRLTSTFLAKVNELCWSNPVLFICTLNPMSWVHTEKLKERQLGAGRGH